MEEDTRMEDASEQPLIEEVQDADMEAENSTSPVQQITVEPAGEVNSMDTEETLSGSYLWTIKSFLKQADKVYSEKFEIGTYIWRLLCFPKGSAAPYKHVSVFLEYPEAKFTPHHMAPKASFKLVILNRDPIKNFEKEATHTFTEQETDWGFAQMLPLLDVHDKSGYIQEDGSLAVRVEINVQKDERYAYDSRKETGYVGLKNQGATCYMNSLLQYLYNLPYFRRAVYHMPVPENEEPSKSLPVALQSLCYKLQYSRTAVSTKDLTKSFGWGTYDAFMQHDVQELNRVLCEKLEEKMKNTKVERHIHNLFEGHLYNFIECINVDYKSTRKESFMDLQLDVKGCKNIYDSFTKFCEVEVLNGANQYKTDDHGMQDARKGILFEQLPAVLQLQLKRFEYDVMRDTMVKINDRYEFYDEIDLDEQSGEVGNVLSPNADRARRYVYKLHSVLVHSGGVHGGHYYAYIRPDGKQWLKFDDERVQKAEAREALDSQFGGEDDALTLGTGPNPMGGLKLSAGKFSNAYMLVYVRKADWDWVMCDVGKEDIAKHLLDRLEQEQREKEQRQRDKSQAHLYCSLKISTDEDIRNQVGEAVYFDLVDHDKLPAERCHLRVRKQTKFSELKEEVARRTGIPPAQQRYWTWKRRNNGSFRPCQPLIPSDDSLTLMDLRESRELVANAGPGSKAALMDVKLYLETPLVDSDAHEPLGKDDVLLFIKLYDPVTHTLSYAGHHVMPLGTKGHQLARHLQELHDDVYKKTDKMLLYEEVKNDPTVRVDLLSLEDTLKEMELEHGDIICMQREVDAAEEASCPYPTVDRYLTYVFNRRLVHFRRLQDPGSAEGACTLELLRTDTYDAVTYTLAEKLGLDDPSLLRLTQHNYFSNQPQRNPVKWRGILNLEKLLMHGVHNTDTLYYEVLDMPLEFAEALKNLRVAFHNERGELVGEHQLRLPKEGSVADALAEVAKARPELQGRPMRLLEVTNSKIFKVMNATEKIDSMNDQYWQLRAEVVPADQEQDPLPGERLLHCVHVPLPPPSSSQQPASPAPTLPGSSGGDTEADSHHAMSQQEDALRQALETTMQVQAVGDPLLMRLKADETLGQLKARLEALLGIAPEEFAKWRFVVFGSRPPHRLLADGDVVADYLRSHVSSGPMNEPLLGMVHEDKGGHKRQHNTYRSAYEKPVKIYA